MCSDLLVIVGAQPAAAAVARSAMARAFPSATVIASAVSSEALSLPQAEGAEVMVFLEPPGADLERALAARTAVGLRRWLVIVRDGVDLNDVVGVPSALWQEDFLAKIFRLAWSRTVARRENEQFRGDLKAIGTRVVHDLRSPLGGILSTAESLVETFRLSAPAEVERAQRIIDSEEEVLLVVRSLNTLASAFSSPPALGAFNMSGPAGNALQRFEPKLIVRGDRVQVPEAWPEIVGDERKVEIVWTLLLQNVLKHTVPGRVVTIAWQALADQIEFSVADDGAGVPDDRRSLLFWPFHRLHEPQAARGFGLPIVERLVRLQGGRCDYRPAQTGGAVFVFTLPACLGV